MQTYRSQSAIARCYKIKEGLWQADYTGPMCMSNALVLGRCVSRHTRQAKCTIERLDGALRLFHGVARLDQMDYLIGSPPGCLVCSDEGIDQAREFCRLMARQGVIRVAFRTDELLDALAFSSSLLRA